MFWYCKYFRCFVVVVIVIVIVIVDVIVIVIVAVAVVPVVIVGGNVFIVIIPAPFSRPFTVI